MKVLLRLCGCAAAPLSAADRFEDVRGYIREALVTDSVPSIAVAVAKDGKIIWEEGFGWADREKRIHASEHTVYSLASITKPLTATGLMVLVEEGKIDLDRPINDYLGNAKLRARVGDAREATVRRVANHTSGLPRYCQFFYADEPYTRPSMDETILRYGELVTAPGEEAGYSNLGYGVLDYIIERASGSTYADFMRERVFLPLGMTRSSVDIGPGLETYVATRYGLDGLPLPFYDFDHPGASAVFASAHDLVRFGMFQLKAHLRDQRQILTDASIDEMHKRTAHYAKDSGYGIGFVSIIKDGYRVVSHNGSMGGVTTQMQLFPDQRLAVVVLSNSGSNLPDAVVERIVKKMLPRWQRKNAKPFSVPAFVPPQSLLGVWNGTMSTYVKDLPVKLHFLSSGTVEATVGEQLTMLVNRPRIIGGVFYGELPARIGTPDTERHDYVVSLSLRQRGDRVLNGVANAMGVNDARVRNVLTHWLEVTKE